MALGPGTRLGVYEIIGLLGSGGMGEVYRSRDVKLQREVAIKVLPQALHDDSERLARFEREAKTLAALSHPNIAHVYGLEESTGAPALVMELVEGPTLADRLAKGPIPLDEALPIAKQIAEGLEAAHEHGIIHRDLKPANIKLRDDGAVKILDFGLAKALEPKQPSGVSLTQSPTITTPAMMTGIGVILGTAAYMAPEQAKGKPADRRADIWAFGVVVYEMLAGRRGYDAEDVSDTLAAVLTREVDWKALPVNTPPAVQALVRDCLVRDPRQRLRDIGDARRVLDRVISGAPDPFAAVRDAATDSVRRPSVTVPWMVAALLLTGASALAWVHFREQPTVRHSVRFQIHAAEKSSIGGFALSPDGQSLAFATMGTMFGVQGVNKLWIRPLGSLDAHALPGTDGAAFGPDQLFWSPDGAFLGFVQDGRLKKVAVGGGPPQTLATVSSNTRGVWGANHIILSHAPGGPIQRVPDGGGTPESITTKLDTASQPQFLPDGRHFLYSRFGSGPESGGIYVGSLDDESQSKRILLDTSPAKYVPADGDAGRRGYVLFIRDTTLMAQAFDANSLAVTGATVPLAEAVGRFSVSQTGTLAYARGGRGPGGGGGAAAPRQELLWIDRSGKQIDIVAPPATYRSWRLSPDERSVVFDRSDAENSDIWVLDLARGVTSRITFDAAVDNLPIWSYDGRRILWPSRRSGAFDLYIKPASGAGQDEKLIAMATPTGWGTDWSRDGKFVLYQRPGDKTGQDLWIAPQAVGPSVDAPKPFPYLQSPFNEANGVFSPDGRWIAYESDESGRAEVYVQAFPLTSEKVRISSGGGTDAAWGRNGKELFYLAANRELMAVPYRSTATTFEPGTARTLFPIPGGLVRRSYAPSADGRRFLVGRPVDENMSEPVTIVLNWAEELRQRAPVK